MNCKAPGQARNRLQHHFPLLFLLQMLMDASFTPYYLHITHNFHCIERL